jgi:hypothetical protein
MNKATSLSLRVAAVLAGLILFATGAQAQDTTEQHLKRKLAERDKVIAELLERVEALERRAGLYPGARAPNIERAGSQTEAETGTEMGTETGSRAEAGSAPGAAPGAVVVDEGAAERALERALTRTGALLLPSGFLEVEPSLTYARQEDSTPSFVSSGATVLASETERNTDSLTAGLDVRLGLPWDAQLELGLPYRWRERESVTSVGFATVETSSDSGSGLGDLRVGLAKTLLREGLWRPDLVGRLTWDTDSGSSGDNGLSLGGGFHEVRASLSAIKRQDPIAFVGGLSYEYAFEKDLVQPGAAIAANFGSFVALSPETTLSFVLSGAYRDESTLSGREIAGSDQAVGTFLVGGSTLLAPGMLLNLSTGIGLTDDADDFSITLSLPIRFGPIY